MDLAVLKTYLESLGNPVVLKGDDQQLDAGLSALVQTMPGSQISADISDGGISIDESTLTIRGTSRDTWPVQGLSPVTLTLATVTLTVTDDGTADAALGATLPLAPGDTASVTLAPKRSGVWSVALDGPSGNVTPTELIALGVAGPLPFPAPPELSLLDQAVTVDPAAFRVLFSPNTDDDAYYAFKVSSASASWPLIPGVLDFVGLDLATAITTVGWSATITGHLVIASVGVDLGLQVADGPVWGALLVPADEKTFPGVVELAQWIAGGGDLDQQTSTGFANLGLSPEQFDLALSQVSLTVDTDAAKVTSLLIGSQLTVSGVLLELVLTLPELTVAGSLASPTRVVDMLQASGIDTAGVPTALSLSEADFSADAAAGTYSLDVTVDGIWPVQPLELNEITASVGYTQGQGFTGLFGAQVGVAGTTVSLSASYDESGDGWSFSGTTDSNTHVAIGDLLTDLAGKFGITTVPAPVSSLDLTSITVSYATGTSLFDFACEAGLDVNGTAVAVTVTITTGPAAQLNAHAAPGTTVVPGTMGYSAIFTGQVTFADLQFDIVFDTVDTGTDVLVADFVHTSSDPVDLQYLVAGVSADLAQAIPPGISVDLEEVKFVLLKQGTSMWAFGLRLGTEINLSELPLVGSKLPPDATLALRNLQILYSSAGMTADQIAVINPLLPPGVVPLPGALAEGIAFDADVQLGSASEHLHAGVTPPLDSPRAALPAARAALPAAPLPAAADPSSAEAPASSTDPVQWLGVNRQFGIFAFKRIGTGYQDNVLLFALDASVALGPVAFSLQALTVGSSLADFKPEFSLNGLALTFDQPPVSIGGAFLKSTQTVAGKKVESYYGEAVVQAGNFALRALGGWTPDADPSSFFLYVSIDYPLGGPPFLYVTGLSGGFGINSRLILPTVDQVHSYPLLPSNAPAELASPAETISAVIPALQGAFQPQASQYWLAAGISFTSFEMIRATAVVSAAFGVDLQIGVIGTCAMTFPTGDPNPVAYVEIEVVASFTPSTGLLAVDGKLSPASYLFGDYVKLTGGFAFYAWFSGDNAGDFVVSIGGYHPAFDKPDNYPAVPRLALAFATGPVKVTGQAYFALTPSMFMAGMRMTATFEAGPVKAWFDAGLDFLIAWAPFHYEADAWVTIGCSVDLGLFTLSVQVGADLQVWGPEFGGQAQVDLDVVSFTISFGAAPTPPAPVGWSTFAANFLPPADSAPAPVALLAHAAASRAAPAPTAQMTAAAAEEDPAPNIVKATVTAGLLPLTAPGVDWIVDPDQFRILTATTIPANHALWVTSASDTAELPNVVADYQRAAAPAVDSAAVDSAAAAPPPAQMLLRLDYASVTYSDTQVWAPTLGIAPMGEADVASYHTVTLRRRDETGAFTEYVTSVTVAPQLSASNTALWGEPAPGDGPNAPRLISATLTGFAISPVPRQPDQVSDVPLLELIFGEGNSTGFGYPAPAADQQFTVTSAVSSDGDTLTIDVAGGHTATLQNQGYVLSALNDPWVAGQRTTTLDELTRLGFSTTASSAVYLDTMADTALTDWPGTARIGMEAWA
jgi:hypothetical protein